MKFTYYSLFTLILAFFSNHILFAQITTEQIKKDWIGKEWKIIKYETFGIEEEPTEEQMNDKILLNSDMTFIIVEKGVEYKGKWRIQSPYAFCKSESSTWERTYKIMSIEATSSTIEYKDPDLTKTLYYLVTE